MPLRPELANCPKIWLSSYSVLFLRPTRSGMDVTTCSHDFVMNHPITVGPYKISREDVIAMRAILDDAIKSWDTTCEAPADDDDETNEDRLPL
jgi:hypothetical protein